MRPSIGHLILWCAMVALSSCANGICHPIKHPELIASAGPGTAENTNVCSGARSGSASCDQLSTANDTSLQSQTGTNPTGTFGPGVTNDSTNNNSLQATRVAGLKDLKTVNVFKPDGSLQCNMGHSIPAEEMEKQLAGIRVISRKRQSDGKMHMQLCGSATGYLNVYEIPETSLADALARGFKKL